MRSETSAQNMNKPRVFMELDDRLLSSMAVGTAFDDYTCKINSIDFHENEDFLVTTSDDESIRLYDTANALCLKTINSKKYGVDQICFTHNKGSVVYSSKNGWDESLRFLSLHDNKYIRYFKGHRDRVVSLCICPKSDFFLSGSLDHTIRMWDLRINLCQGMFRVRGRPSVAYDKQGLIFGISMEGGVIKLFDVRLFDKGPFDTFVVGGESSEVSNIKFSNDGKLLLLSSSSSHVYVLDALSGIKLHEFILERDPDGGTLEASFSTDGQYVLSGSGDKTLHAWSTASGQEVATWASHGGVPAIAKWAPERLMFASSSNSLSFYVPHSTKLTFPYLSSSDVNNTEHPPC